ncbi:MAG: VOC family protein, partial [Anaerolineae bacterium]|nr:VOC family protein [Anaerolineae bacterium]
GSPPAAHPAVGQQITFYFTYDIERTARFYGEVLGLREVHRARDTRIWQITETAFLGFSEHVNIPLAPPDNSIFALVSPDVDGWYTHLKKHHVRIVQPPALNRAGGVYQFQLRDPNGFLIEIRRFEKLFPPAEQPRGERDGTLP